MTVLLTIAILGAVPLVATAWCVLSDRRYPIPELTDAEAAAQDAWEDQYDAAYWAHR